MKKIFRIARLELSILFYSPIAWLLLIIFIIQCVITYLGLIDPKETSQQLGYALTDLSRAIFGGSYGFFSAVQHKLYLYIPLLTMGLMSRELSSGSIKLLYSSPLTTRQIILGKYLAMVAFCTLLVLVLLGIMLFGVITIESLDVKYILGGILGLYLLICAYSAIGLFMSTLTPYQVVAAFSTLALLAGLNYIGTIGQSIDFVRDITYWLSISGRADNFINGLISSKDIIYFILVIGLFLTLSMKQLNSGRKSESTTSIIGNYGILIVLVLSIGYLSSLAVLTKYYDTTRFKNRTLSENSQKLLLNMDKPIKITSYVNVNQLNTARLGSPKWRIFDLKQFDNYLRFLPNIEMKYIPYYDYTLNGMDETDKTLLERTHISAIAFGFNFDEILSPDELSKIIDIKAEENLFVRKVEYDGKTTSLRMYYDQYVYPHEEEISASFKRLLVSPPVIGVLVGNDERSIDKTGDGDYKDIMNTLTSRKSLINQGFDVINISIDQGEIPLNLAVLMIANPLESYTSDQVNKIEKYIDSGGNIIISGEPGKQAILNPLIKKMGAEFTSGVLLQESKDFELNLLQVHITDNASKYGFSQLKKDIISMPSTLGLKYEVTANYKVTPILVTDKNEVWNKTGEFNLETDNIKFDQNVETKISIPVALAITKDFKDKEQKIMILGDADFMSNGELNRRNLTNENFSFTTDMFKWFSGGEFPIDATKPKPIDNKIILSREGLSWLKIIFGGILPAFLAIMGAIMLMRRKRK